MDCSQYLNTMPYPNEKDFDSLVFGKVGMVTRQFTAKNFAAEVAQDAELAGMSFATELQADMNSKNIHALLNTHGFIAKIEPNKEAYLAARDAYNRHGSELYHQFTVDLLEELGLSDIPEEYTGRILGVAYNRGHSGGLSDIASVAHDLADMAEPLIDFYRANRK